MLTKDQLKAASESERLANEAKFEAAIIDYITLGNGAILFVLGVKPGLGQLIDVHGRRG